MTERILFYPEIVTFGGGERILLGLSRHLHQSGIAHRIVSYYQEIDLASHADWPLTVETLSPSRHPLRKARALCAYLKRQRAAGAGAMLLTGIQSALHVGAFGADDYVLIILDTPSLLSTAQNAKRGPGALKHAARERLTRLLTRRGMLRARRIIGTSDYMAREMKTLYGVNALVARQGGFPPGAAFRPRAVAGGETVRLLSVSRLEENKRIDWIIESVRSPEFQSAMKDVANWHLDIVGTGREEESLKSRVANSGLGVRVTFHGYVSDDRLEAIYGAAHLFVMPARQGYGLPALEALSRGLPVVMHEESGVSEILRGTPWVELMDGKSRPLAAALVRMIRRLKSGGLASEPLPAFPSESDWAREVCRICDWR